MRVTVTTLDGTIGGGQLEYRAVAQARLLLACSAEGWRVQDYPLGPLLGQCCGGRVRLLIERADESPEGDILTFTDTTILRSSGNAPPFSARGDRPRPGDAFAAPKDEPRTPLFLFGAGHVGQAVARAVASLPFQLAWFDSRPEQGAIDGVVTLTEAEVPGCLADASPESAVLIMTHDHALDYRLATAALASPAAYVGLIGSNTKRARFVTRLEADGLDVARLTCPIGIAGIHGKEPAVIAASVAAQLLLEVRP